MEIDHQAHQHKQNKEVRADLNKLVVGNKYKWRHEPQILYYIGRKNGWHQLELIPL